MALGLGVMVYRRGFSCIRSDVRAAPDRPRGDGIGQCHLRHDPAEAAQDRRAGADQRAPGQRRHGLRLPVAGRVRTGPEGRGS